MAKVTLTNVDKIYPGNVKAVDNFNLEIRDGEFLVMVGPSGCGKSTTLRMVAGLEEISAGTIKIGERVVNNVAPKDRDIAMVFQNYALYPHMSVRDNLAFGLKLRHFPKEEIKKRVAEAAKILGIEDLMERRPKALSGGQRQRVAVGRAIVRKPAVFLFDEPLSNLDAKMRVQMRVEISRLHAQLKTTMIYVTHDQVEAMTMGERIVVMKDGLIQQVADPLTLYDRPANKFVGGFIGTPPMNFFNGIIRKEKGTLVFDNEAGETLPVVGNDAVQAHEGKKIILGLRPEAIGSASAEEAKQGYISADVDVVEQMGSESYLYCKGKTQNFICRVDAHTPIRAQQSVKLAVHMQFAHFFDAETEQRI